MILVKDFSTFGDLGNRNLTWESPQISTRWSQTPDEGIGTLSGKCGTQEVFDDSHLNGNIEGSLTDVTEDSQKKRPIWVIHSDKINIQPKKRL